MPRSVWQSVESLFACLSIVATALPAHGAARRLTAYLEWTAPEASSCPSGSAMAQAVEARLGRGVFVERDQADVILTAAIKPNGAAWSAELELLGARHATLGTRHVQSKSRDCSAFNDVLPIVIALLVDASQNIVHLELPPPSYTPATSPQVEYSSPQAMPSPFSPSDGPSRWGWAVLGEGVHGLMPGTAAGASLVGFFEPARVRVPVEFWLGAIPAIVGNQTQGIQLSLIHLGARLCPNLWRATLHWSVCAGVSVGNLQVVGRGFDVNRSDSSFYADARATAQLDVPVARPWFARVEAGAIAPITRPRFEGEMERGVRVTLHRPATIVPRIALGLGVGFQ